MTCLLCVSLLFPFSATELKCLLWKTVYRPVTSLTSNYLVLTSSTSYCPVQFKLAFSIPTSMSLVCLDLMVFQGPFQLQLQHNSMSHLFQLFLLYLPIFLQSFRKQLLTSCAESFM